MHFAGLDRFGRLATRLATWGAPPYKARVFLARMNAQGYVSPDATIHHKQLERQRGVFIGDRVTIFQSKQGGPVILEEEVHLYSDITIETGQGGMVIIGTGTHIQPRCQLSAYKGSIKIGHRVEIAPACFFYPYNHLVKPGEPIRTQPLVSRGDIVVEDDVWFGVGVKVLENVHIGRCAVIGAGSVVTHDVPSHAVVAGVPARVIKMLGSAS